MITYEYMALIFLMAGIQVYYGFRADDRVFIWGLALNAVIALNDTGEIIYCLLKGRYADIPMWGIGLAFAIFIIWLILRQWKNKDKVKAALGAKTKALRDKIVRRMRETEQPTPVRIPA